MLAAWNGLFTGLFTYFAQILTGFFEQSTKIPVLLSFLSFLIGLSFALVSLGNGETSSNRRRLCGVFLLLSVVFESSNPAVYGLGVFIVATLITELDFLSKLAAIFWNRPWAYTRPATPDEILSSARNQEVIQHSAESSDKEPSENEPGAEDQARGANQPMAQEEPAPRPLSGFDYERRALDALSQSGLFDHLQYETAITTLADPSRPLMVVDAIGWRGYTQYVIEVKYRMTGDPRRVTQQVRSAINALKNTPENRRKFLPPRIRGIVVTTRTGRDARIGTDIFCLFFDPDSGTFSNLEAGRNWMDYLPLDGQRE